MATIKNIKLKNFKAFYGEETIALDGKHLLLYGENGSGKSSIYWALYTLLQSATKDTSQIEKYFIPNNEEHLINYAAVDENTSINAQGVKELPHSLGLNSFVEIELTNGEKLRIDSRGIAPITNKNTLEDINKFSDFISHRLLINFYNFRNSKEINLWEVFVRDVFPFVMNNSGNGTKNLSQLLNDIETNKPYHLNYSTKRYKITRSTNRQKEYNKQISKFNKEVTYWLGEINRKLSTFYNNNLKQKEDVELEISLLYKNELKFNKLKPQFYIKDGVEFERWSNLADLNNPTIAIKIAQKNTDGTFTEIQRPQSFLNEARLTSIALAIRFSLLDNSIRPEYEGQFLALDDLLVSLDMANRDKVLDIILKEFAPKYKIYLFTHERAFFNLVNQRLVLDNLKEDWKVKEMFMDATTLPQTPKLVDDSDYISKALKALNSFDLPVCANSLRKECEQSLKRILPKNLSISFNKDGTAKYKQLNDLIATFDKFYRENLGQTDNKYSKLNQYKTFILNPLSHDNLDSEYYFSELKDAIYLMKELRKLKVLKTLMSDSKLYYKQIDYNTSIEWTYTIVLRENLIAYQIADSSIIIPNIKCTATGKTGGSNSVVFCKDYKLKSFPEMAYKASNQGKNPPASIDFLKVLEDENNTTLRDKLGL